MKKIFMIIRLAFFTLVVLFIGCASSSLRDGRSYLLDENYPEALKELTKALNNDPGNYKINRDLGIVYFKTEEYVQAIVEFQKAKRKLPKDGLLMFYLGLTYEKLGQYEKAIEEYSNYTKLSRFDQIKDKLKHRIYYLSRTMASQWAIERMKLEKEIDPVAIPDNSVAVTYFRPVSVSEELRALNVGLTDLIIYDLSIIESLTVIERIKLREIYEELGLSATDLVDQNAAPRMGKLLGASSLVTGTFTGLGVERWRVDPALGMVKTNQYELLKGIENQFARFIEVEKALVFDILKTLSIEPTKEELKKIVTNIPTESLQAFLAYSRGLEYLDRGMYSEAIKEFEKAISLDSKFRLAKERLGEANLLSKPLESISDLEIAFANAVSLDRDNREFMSEMLSSVSSGDTRRSPLIEAAVSEKEAEEVEVDILLQW